MRKRKNDDSRFSLPRFTILLALGAVLLAGLSVFGILALLINQRAPAANPTAVVTSTKIVATRPIATPSSEINAPSSKIGFLYSTLDGALADYSEASGIRQTALKGQDVAASIDGKTMAYIRDNQLYIFGGGREQEIEVNNEPAMPVWNLDGSLLYFVVREMDKDVLYSVVPETALLARLLEVKHIVAPPLPSASAKRLFIAEFTGPSETAVYSIDLACTSMATCWATRDSPRSVPYGISWASIHPDGSRIVFTDSQRGHLYLFTLASGVVNELDAGDRSYKNRVSFNHDGTALAYLDSTNKLSILTLRDMQVHLVPLTGVESMAWVAH
jgi:hypothetical protein